MKIRTDFLTTPPAAQPAGGGAANTMSNFASLLQQQSRAPALAPAQPPAAAAPAHSEATAADRKAETGAGESANSRESTEAPDADRAAADEAANKPRPPNKPRARQADAQPPARTAHEENASARSEKKSTAADDDTPATPADPKDRSDGAMPGWPAGWMAPPTSTLAPTAPGAGAAGQRSTGMAEVAEGTDTTLPGDTDAGGIAAGAARGRAQSAGARKAGAREALDATGDGGTTSNAKEPPASLPGFATVLAERRQAEAAPGRDAGLPSLDGARGALASSAPAAGSVPHDAGSTSAAHVRAAVGSPEFPQELGVQLSVLARDGIQQAELHLNPTEMGPVSVQIVMDGTQARIDFGADVAATRHAIEAGLPELASALRDAGFTLAGGGVSQHAGGRQGSDGDGARRDGGATRGMAAGVEGGDGAPRIVRTRFSAGGVDLYA